MKKWGLFHHLNLSKDVKEELVNFVAYQFKQLKQKHLKIPIQLFQL
jgi:hypothetical protein